MVDGGERVRTLDDAFGTRVTVRSCCGKRFEKKRTAKDAKIIRLSLKYSKKKIRPSCEIMF